MAACISSSIRISCVGLAPAGRPLFMSPARPSQAPLHHHLEPLSRCCALRSEYRLVLGIPCSDASRPRAGKLRMTDDKRNGPGVGHGESRPRRPQSTSPRRSSASSRCFPQDLRPVGHDLVQALAFVRERLQELRAAHTTPGDIRLPPVVRVRGETVAPDHFTHRRTGYGFLQDGDEPLFGVALAAACQESSAAVEASTGLVFQTGSASRGQSVPREPNPMHNHGSPVANDCPVLSQTPVIALPIATYMPSPRFRIRAAEGVFQ